MMYHIKEIGRWIYFSLLSEIILDQFYQLERKHFIVVSRHLLLSFFTITFVFFTSNHLSMENI